MHQKLSNLAKTLRNVENGEGSFFASLKERGTNDIRLLPLQLDLHAAPASCFSLKIERKNLCDVVILLGRSL